MNEATLSGKLDLASGGVGPPTIWGKTRGNIGAKGDYR
jgi:NitT/TauT family transport system substrate-binding protein